MIPLPREDLAREGDATVAPGYFTGSPRPAEIRPAGRPVIGTFAKARVAVTRECNYRRQ